MPDYQPGVCNIGTEERQKRRTLGAISALAGGGFSLFVLVSGRPEAALLWTFPLWAGAFTGFFQDRLGFCVGFGVMARYDLSGSGGDAGTVSEAAAIRRDRRRALEVVAFAVLAAALTTASVYGVGVVA